MADEDEPVAEEPSGGPEDDDVESGGRHLFGIDLGHRGNRAEQKSRDEVQPAPVQKVKAVVRTLTERLASAASERDDAASKKKQEKREAEKREESED